MRSYYRSQAARSLTIKTRHFGLCSTFPKKYCFHFFMFVNKLVKHIKLKKIKAVVLIEVIVQDKTVATWSQRKEKKHFMAYKKSEVHTNPRMLVHITFSSILGKKNQFNICIDNFAWQLDILFLYLFIAKHGYSSLCSVVNIMDYFHDTLNLA